MAAVYGPSAVADTAKMFQTSESCSVCLDSVIDSGERSIAKLKCGHHFHLDCIGSAFNAKGAMQCPNCRSIEDGQWLYANGARWTDDFSIDDFGYEDDYEVYHTIPSLVGHDLTNLHWCPYQEGGPPHEGSHFPPHLSFSLGEVDGPSGFSEVVLNVSYETGVASSPRLLCPHLAAQVRQSLAAEDARMRPMPPIPGTAIRSPEHLVGATPNVGSGGGGLGGDGDTLSNQGSLWIPSHHRHGGMSMNSVSGGYSADTPSLTDRTRLSPDIDLSFLPRTSGTTLSGFYGDPGPGGGAGGAVSSHERHRSWNRSEAAQSRSTGISSYGFGDNYGSDYSFIGPHLDGGVLQAGPGPCPRHPYGSGQVGTSQSHLHSQPTYLQQSTPLSQHQHQHHQHQPQLPSQSGSQSSSLRNAPIGSGRRSRQATAAAATAAATAAAAAAAAAAVNSSSALPGPRTATTLGRSGERRLFPTWSDNVLLGQQEPPVPGLESHYGGPSYHSSSSGGGHQGGFVPWSRRENSSGSSNSLWAGSPEPLWQPSSARSSSSDLQSFPSFRGMHADYMEGNASSRQGPPQAPTDYELFQSNMYVDLSPPSLLGPSAVETANLINPPIQLPRLR